MNKSSKPYSKIKLASLRRTLRKNKYLKLSLIAFVVILQVALIYFAVLGILNQYGDNPTAENQGSANSKEVGEDTVQALTFKQCDQLGGSVGYSNPPVCITPGTIYPINLAEATE